MLVEIVGFILNPVFNLRACVQNHYKGSFVAITPAVSRFQWRVVLSFRPSGFDSRHKHVFNSFVRKLLFLANCSTILSAGNRLCLERPYRRFLAPKALFKTTLLTILSCLSAEGPV